jgi:hypothetical protein
VPLAEQTLRRLEQIARNIEVKRNVHVEPMQVAALLFESITRNLADEDAARLVQSFDSSH